jgi:hypothetical protein
MSVAGCYLWGPPAQPNSESAAAQLRHRAVSSRSSTSRSTSRSTSPACPAAPKTPPHSYPPPPRCARTQVLAAIGEQFAEGEEVCGVAVNIRPAKDRVELWTRTAANEAAQTSIGKQFKQTLDLGDSSRLGYVVFVGGPAAAPRSDGRRAAPRCPTAGVPGALLLPPRACSMWAALPSRPPAAGPHLTAGSASASPTRSRRSSQQAARPRTATRFEQAAVLKRSRKRRGEGGEAGPATTGAASQCHLAASALAARRCQSACCSRQR